MRVRRKGHLPVEERSDDGFEKPPEAWASERRRCGRGGSGGDRRGGAAQTGIVRKKSRIRRALFASQARSMWYTRDH